MNESRREFLKQSGCCALGMAAMATQMHHFGTISAFAQKAIDDGRPNGGENYKALVMLYFDGGNDSNNMIIPVHNDPVVSNYAAYTAARGVQGDVSTYGLGFSQAQLQNTQFTVPRLNDLAYAMHPSLGPAATGAINNGIYELYSQGKLAIVPNVGTLVRPLSKGATYNSTPKPYQIGSHSDQKTQFQTSISNSQAFTGWGGRVSDKMTAGQNPNGLVPMITSIAGVSFSLQARRPCRSRYQIRTQLWPMFSTRPDMAPLLPGPTSPAETPSTRLDSRILI